MKIVVGYLAGAGGRAALEVAVEEAKVHAAELVLFRHVHITEQGEDRTAALNEAREDLDARVEELSGRGVTATAETAISLQSAATALVGHADQIGADRIVIAVRRRSRVGKLVLGSDAQNILLNANCPVVAVKPDGE